MHVSEKSHLQTIKLGHDRKWAGIVIVSYNSGADLQKCIDSLDAQSCQDFEVIIIDNASPDTAVHDLELPNARYQRHYSKENIGFAGASNLGAELVQTDWIITLNPDAWPEPDWLQALKTASKSHPTFSMLSSTLLKADSPDCLDGFGDYLTVFGIAKSSAQGRPYSSVPTYPVEVFAPCGAAACYRRDVFLNAGGFDESFFCYLEDVDLALRLRLYGECCLQCPAARVVHVGSSSTSKQPGFKMYYSHRNNVPLIIKNTPLILLFIMLPLFLLSQVWFIMRTRGQENTKARTDGLVQGIKTIPSAVNARRKILPSRALGSWKMAKKLTWTITSVRSSIVVFWPVISVVSASK